MAYFQASGGTDTSDANARSEDILSTKTAYVDDEKVVGSMPNIGHASSDPTLNCGENYTIPEGYHDGAGKVRANSLASQTSATAGTGDILSGATAWVNGTRLSGSMTNRGAWTSTGNNCNASSVKNITIPVGYHNGSGYVQFNSLSSQTTPASGKTAVGAGQMLTGYSGWVNGSQINGTMANNGAFGASLLPGQSKSGSAGYYSSISVSAPNYGTVYIQKDDPDEVSCSGYTTVNTFKRWVRGVENGSSGVITAATAGTDCFADYVFPFALWEGSTITFSINGIDGLSNLNMNDRIEGFFTDGTSTQLYITNVLMPIGTTRTYTIPSGKELGFVRNYLSGKNGFQALGIKIDIHYNN